LQQQYQIGGDEMRVVKSFSIDNDVLQKLEKLAKQERKRLSEKLEEIIRMYLKGEYNEKTF
jgi:metal-responsive CopG/Arc/MetJ family transcriptional regulator